MTIEIVTTSESLEQAEALLNAGADTLYVGKDEYGLRLPYSFSNDELSELVKLVHERGKKVTVAVNALMHNDHINGIKEYLKFLEALKVDQITVGDPGVVQVMRNEGIKLDFIYDAQTLVTNARQINFWAKRGASGAVLARELTQVELKAIAEKTDVPLEILVYGATCIHQSLRPLVENYFNFTNQEEDMSKERGLFLSEPKRKETQYSVYEDRNGTHVFATDDINLMPHIKDLYADGLTRWKLDGIFTPGHALVEITKLFKEAKDALLADRCTDELVEELNQALLSHHPQKRTLNEGFFLMDPDDVK